MKEFILVFRNAPMAGRALSPEEMQNISRPWQDWMSSMAAQNKIASYGNRLYNEGATVKPGNVVTDGPFIEIKEMILGYSVVKAETLEGAIELAKGCPVLTGGGSVEVRAIVQMNMQ